MSNFGTYPDQPRPWSFFGLSGWWSVPGGRNWHQMVDSGNQIWVSEQPLVKNADGTVSATVGYKKYAAELNADGTLVFQDQLANRHINIDSPAYDRLSQGS